MGYASTDAIFGGRYVATIKLLQEMWINLVNYQKTWSIAFL